MLGFACDSNADGVRKLFKSIALLLDGVIRKRDRVVSERTTWRDTWGAMLIFVQAVCSHPLRYQAHLQT